MVMSAAAMRDSSAISFTTDPTVSPSIISFLTAMMYHLAGMILENHCNGKAIFSTG